MSGSVPLRIFEEAESIYSVLWNVYIEHVSPVLLLPTISINRVSFLLFCSLSLTLIKFEMQQTSPLLIKYGGSGLSSIPQSFSKTVQTVEKVIEATVCDTSNTSQVISVCHSYFCDDIVPESHRGQNSVSL
jgi:hypothetical protein